MKKLAVIRLRGTLNISKELSDTLKFMHLHYKHHAAVIDATPANIGMIKKVRDFITWGEISKEVFTQLLVKRGRLSGNKRLSMKDSEVKKFVTDFFTGKAKLKDIGVKPVFRLSPPSGGFERRGIKKPLKDKGALGPRRAEIDKLLLKMI